MTTANRTELRPGSSSAHWQSHALLGMGKTAVGIYSRLERGSEVNSADVVLSVSAAGFSMGLDLDGANLCLLLKGLHDAGCKAQAIRELATPPASDEWFRRVEMSEGFIDAARAGVSYRVFAEQLRPKDAATVSLNMYMLQGFAGGSGLASGDLTPDAAEQLARALMEAAQFARGVNEMAKDGAA
ncbi:MAG: hypothetical protein LBJ40_19810 [Delftia acidovorans]|nr:hypothetical protein [Delftia acidovorans]